MMFAFDERSFRLASRRVLAGLVVCSFGMMLTVLNVAAKDNKKEFSSALGASTGDELSGFRSAHFGMDEKKILKAIYRDFKIPKSKIKRQTHAREKNPQL